MAQQLPPAQADRLLLMDEVAEILRVPLTTLRYWRMKGEGGPNSFRMGRRVFYRSSVVDEYVAAHELADSNR